MKTFEMTEDNCGDPLVDKVISVLHETLQIADGVNGLDLTTALLGNIPELDSMAVLAILTALEEQFGIAIDDDVSAETFETVGSLVALVREKTD